MNGDPILRPMLYEFLDDVATYHLVDQVMLGSHLLVAPVLRPGITKRVVYLPAGEWYDWWIDSQYTGPTHILAAAPPDRLPLYVRAGGMIPLAPVMQYTGERAGIPCLSTSLPAMATLASIKTMAIVLPIKAELGPKLQCGSWRW
ncbi:MAG: hypothetical protein HC924_11890 [Synechococcaceae cyanobacterium SM2_3_2]|nr:hypothetical protein [Synechococcaceae cyanobacterium SM2_3_2]